METARSQCSKVVFKIFSNDKLAVVNTYFQTETGGLYVHQNIIQKNQKYHTELLENQ